MIKFIFCISLILYSSLLFSQRFISRSGSRIRNAVTHYYVKHRYHTIFQETDNTLTFLIRDTSVLPRDSIYHFDGNGKCDTEINRMGCEKCYTTALQKVFNHKYYGWMPLRGNAWIARYHWHMSLESSAPGDPYTSVIKRVRLSKDEFRDLVNAK
ncbi:MAG: hypothetical protein JWN76_303 [Chitinophagaceae bacterium]|nr:hypothetical protein [Chitinophagaceae bacterium]